MDKVKTNREIDAEVNEVLHAAGIPAKRPHGRPRKTYPGPRVQMVCKTCGSDEVLADAYAEWFARDQKWVLAGEPFDKGAYCSNCDGESRIEPVNLANWQARKRYHEAKEAEEVNSESKDG